MKALFVTTVNALGAEGSAKGGVQVCTAEYLTVLCAAGFEISTITFTPDQRLQTRVKRRLCPMPYQGLIPPSLAVRVVDEIKRTGAQVVFLNLVDLAPLAGEVRQLNGTNFKIILLSHGLHSADILHNLRIESSRLGCANTRRRDLLWLSRHLAVESIQRQFIDHVFCLSEFEVGLERWIGSRSVSWLPRIVEIKPLAWQPNVGRFGFVGTLNHPPNAEGLNLFLKALVLHDVSARVRVVGGPIEAAQELSIKYPVVDYLGQLDDQQLAREAATWTCAVHPLFCYARGCSTKLATYLAWQIPVVTTPQGSRGYSWKEGNIPQANDPNGLVKLALSMNKPEVVAAARMDLAKVAATSPTLHDVAQMVALSLADIIDGLKRNRA
jgi:hypothetical protein